MAIIGLAVCNSRLPLLPGVRVRGPASRALRRAVWTEPLEEGWKKRLCKEPRRALGAAPPLWCEDEQEDRDCVRCSYPAGRRGNAQGLAGEPVRSAADRLPGQGGAAGRLPPAVERKGGDGARSGTALPGDGGAMPAVETGSGRTEDTTTLNYDGLESTSGLDDFGGGRKGIDWILLAHCYVATDAGGRGLRPRGRLSGSAGACEGNRLGASGAGRQVGEAAGQAPGRKDGVLPGAHAQCAVPGCTQGRGPGARRGSPARPSAAWKSTWFPRRRSEASRTARSRCRRGRNGRRRPGPGPGPARSREAGHGHLDLRLARGRAGGVPPLEAPAASGYAEGLGGTKNPLVRVHRQQSHQRKEKAQENERLKNCTLIASGGRAAWPALAENRPLRRFCAARADFRSPPPSNSAPFQPAPAEIAPAHAKNCHRSQNGKVLAVRSC